MMDGLDIRYLFTITAPFATRWVGKTPAGYRIDLDYAADVVHVGGVNSGPRVSTDLEKLKASWPQAEAAVEAIHARQPPKAPGAGPDSGAEHAKGARNDAPKWRHAREHANDQELTDHWFGLEGTIAAGMDWAVVRAGGIADFDGRLTLRDESGVLVNAVVLGSVDLFRGGNRPLTLDQAVENLRDTKDAKVGFALALRFEAAQEPETWAAKSYRREGTTRYRRLSRGQCLGIGSLSSFAIANSNFTLDVVTILPKDDALWKFGEVGHR